MIRAGAVFLVLFRLVGAGHGADGEGTLHDSAAQEEVFVYRFPEIKPEYAATLGYRFVGDNNAGKAGEYEYLHNSVTGGGEITLFPFPHRFHLEGDVQNKKDYFLDVSYAYKDLFLFRGINRTLYHNLDTITLIDLDPATASPGVLVLDPGEHYGTTTGISTAFVRLKAPDYPLHLYLDGRYYTTRGDMQQRFLGGSGSFNNIVRVSTGRDVDWTVKEIAVGFNSHLGPVEVDYSHSEERFDTGGTDLIAYTYTSAGAARPAGLYPNNLVPAFKGSTDTVKIHTSYTGRLVASATASWADRENRESGARADYFTGNAEVVYVPFQKLTLIGKYIYRERDLDNPSSLPAGYLGFSSYTTSLTGIRPSLSSTVDALSGAARYRPFTGLALSLDYLFERTRRDNADDWELPDTTKRQRIALQANMRLTKELKLKLRYAHQDTDNPPYNVVPETSDQGSVSISWTPVKWVSALVSYDLIKGKSDDIHYVGMDPTLPAEHRDSHKDRVVASITFVPVKEFSITPSYTYLRNKIRQDLVYNSAVAPFNDQLDTSVPYEDTAYSYAVTMTYAPTPRMSVFAEASYTKGEGGFSPGNEAGLLPVSIASFSDLKIRETTYAIGGDYTFSGNWALGIRYRYNSFRDLIDNPYDDAENGIFQSFVVTISKKW